MASEKFKYDITEILGVVSTREDLTSDWKKYILRTLMEDKKNGQQEGIDIRRYNEEERKCGSGLRLTIEEANNVANILLENGYGNFDILEKEYNKRKSLFNGGDDNGIDE